MILLKVNSGADFLEGNEGSDTFIATSASDGIDNIDGGTGKDTIDYSNLGSSNNISSLTLAETGKYCSCKYYRWR